MEELRGLEALKELGGSDISYDNTSQIDVQDGFFAFTDEPKGRRAWKLINHGS